MSGLTSVEIEEFSACDFPAMGWMLRRDVSSWPLEAAGCHLGAEGDCLFCISALIRENL